MIFIWRVTPRFHGREVYVFIFFKLSTLAPCILSALILGVEGRFDPMSLCSCFESLD